MFSSGRHALHWQTVGRGPTLAMMHGWGMQGELLRPVADSLAAVRQSIVLDLPGHGYSSIFERSDDIDAMSDYVLAQLQPKTAIDWCGWSLGALLVMNIAARYPHWVNRIVLFTATPCFVTREDWSAAVQPGTLQQFTDQLTRDYQHTLMRFLTLQYRGVEESRQALRQLRARLASYPAPDPYSLQRGLQLLRNVDLRPCLATVQAETLIINGNRDSLVPSCAARYLAEMLPRAQAMLIEGAGHVPFLTHVNRVTDQLRRFLA